MAIPVTLDDAIAQLRLTPDEVDADRELEIEGFIADAEGWIERYTGHILAAREVTEQFRGFGAVQLRAWPIAPNAVPGVAYNDVNGNAVAIVGARLDLSSRPARVLPPRGPFYPFCDTLQLFSVTVRAGYEPDQVVPGNIRRAMLVLIAAYDADRELEIEGFIADAEGWIERYTGHILAARDVTEQFRGFGSVQLRAWPIAPAATPGVAYLDPAGNPVAIVGARLDLSSRPARVLPPRGPFYPFHDTRQLFTVTVRAGYEPADIVPGNLRRAMLVLIAAYDADREGGEVFAQAEKSARSLCSDFRLKRV